MEIRRILEGMRNRDPLTEIPPSKHPFQFWMMAACMMSGFSNMVRYNKDSAFNDLLPPWSVFGWGFILFVSGSLAITAAWWRDRVTGLLLERLALSALAAACTIYAIAVALLVGGDASQTIAFTASAGIASAWRVRHLNHELFRLARFAEREF